LRSKSSDHSPLKRLLKYKTPAFTGVLEAVSKMNIFSFQNGYKNPLKLFSFLFFILMMNCCFVNIKFIFVNQKEIEQACQNIKINLFRS